MAVSLAAPYPVTDGNVSLSIIVGNRQLGTSRARLSGKVIHTGDFADHPLGKGKALKGKTLKIKTIVSDVNDKSNLTTVRYVFTGGVTEGKWDLQATVANEGDSIVYRATFTFV